VMEAYIAGVKRLVERGGDPSTVASVASFFVSRVDTEADKRLESVDGHDELAGKLAIANAKLAYRNFEQLFSSPEWEALEAKGATKQRPLWASTSTKNPEYRDVVYVEELVGPDTVNTMPRETVEAVNDHGEIRGDTIKDDVDAASRILDEFESAGVKYDDVVTVLEREGVEKFAKSFADLIEGLESKLKQVTA
jgi:transaldolase